MPLNAADRAQAVVNAIVAMEGANGSVSPMEQAKLVAFWTAVMVADTAYLTQNASIAPGSLALGAGVPVSTPVAAATLTGATTATGSANPLSGVVAVGIALSVSQPASTQVGATTQAVALQGLGTLT